MKSMAEIVVSSMRSAIPPVRNAQHGRRCGNRFRYGGRTALAFGEAWASGAEVGMR